MQRRFILLGFILFFSGNLFAQATKWTVDKSHSRIGLLSENTC